MALVGEGEGKGKDGQGEVEAQAQVGFSFIAGQKLKSKPNTQVAAQVGFVLITSRAALGASKAHTLTHTRTHICRHTYTQPGSVPSDCVYATILGRKMCFLAKSE